MKIISWNVNGIRAVERKGAIQEFLDTYDPDMFFLQEIKGKVEQFSKYLTENDSYHQYYNSAEKPGYAGTGVWIKKSTQIEHKYIDKIELLPDNEGRISGLEIIHNNKKLLIYGLYFPNGGKSPEAWQGKLVFYDQFLEHINAQRKAGYEVIWTGDVNCAHEEIDLAKPKENAQSIGFLPEERAWISKCIENGWVDVFRKSYPDKIIYSWWHQLTRSRGRNIGWRIDYFFCDQSYYHRVQEIAYHNEQHGSDHCPVSLLI